MPTPTFREIDLEDVRGQFVDVYEGETVKFTFDAFKFYRNSINDTPTPFYNPEVIDVGMEIDGPKGSNWFRHKQGDAIRMISSGEIDSIDLSSYPTPHPVAPQGPPILFNWSRMDENGVVSWEYTFGEDNMMEGDKISHITSDGFYYTISPNSSLPEVVDFNLVLRDTTTPEPEPTVDDVISDDYEVPVIAENPEPAPAPTITFTTDDVIDPVDDVPVETIDPVDEQFDTIMSGASVDSIISGAGVDSISIVDVSVGPYVPPGYEIKPEHLLPVPEYVPAPLLQDFKLSDIAELPEDDFLELEVETNDEMLIINGGDGPDSFVGGLGADTFIGAAVDDTLPEISDVPDPIMWIEVEETESQPVAPVAPVVQHVQNVQNITNNYYNFGTINNTTVTNNYFSIETVGVNLSDAITGDSRKKEMVIGTDGDDLIADSRGKDYLIGGEGADQFYFAGKQPFKKKIADSIVDFDSTEGDSIVISEDVINYPVDPSVGIARNKKNLKQLSKEGYDLLYLKSKGNLYVDGNGYAKGFGNKFIGGMIVDLPNETVLTESDILIGM